MTFKLSKEAKQAFDIIENTYKNVFITGKAGTGKSTLLDHIRLNSAKKIIVLAPTGISAINVDGETIHSFFTLKPGFEKEEAKKMRFDKNKQQKLNRLRTIAIDEISMVRADLLDAIDIVLKRARNSNLPFGGVQMIFFGDLYQLPPVITPTDKEKFFSEYDLPYFFSADVFKGQSDMFASEFQMEIIELQKIYRQNDKNFINILNAVRDNSANDQHLNELNKRVDPTFIPPKNNKYIYLVTTNANASIINDNALRKLRAEPRVFSANQTGKIARNLFPNDEQITVAVGAQIMFICNDAERRWVNGTLGKVIDIKVEHNYETNKSENVILVEKDDGKMVEVKQHLWEISKYVFRGGNFEREKIGSFSQIPIKLAWAITIHKSQGKTFENVIIDLGHGSFAHGQTYVALSRCTSLSGLVLKKPITKNNIIMDKRIQDFC